MLYTYIELKNVEIELNILLTLLALRKFHNNFLWKYSKLVKLIKRTPNQK